MRKIDRREFLKAAPASAGVAAMLGAPRTAAVTQNEAATKRGDVRMSGTAYTPVPDYPIRPQAYSEVKLEDAFWKPKIAKPASLHSSFVVGFATITVPPNMTPAGFSLYRHDGLQPLNWKGENVFGPFCPLTSM